MSKKTDSKETFTSFEELGTTVYNLKPPIKQTRNKEKLKSQREAFSNRHLCPACKMPMSYIEGTNIMSCTNPDCLGIKHSYTNEETGETIDKYGIAYHTLDEKGAEIASNIFAEL